MRSRTRWLVAFAAVLLWLPFQAGDAQQPPPCSSGFWPEGDEDGGVGGTGVRDEDDEQGGVGGTGIQERGDGDGGVGGTGVRAGKEDDGGVGGTGIAASDAPRFGLYGRIAGFGSICVNGVRVSYGPDLRVEVDGEGSNRGALALGQVVALEAVEVGNDLVATRVDVRHALAGPITAVEASHGRLEVMGRSVEMAAGAIVHDRTAERGIVLSDLDSGQFVKVSGLRASGGRVIASRLDRVPAAPSVRVEGALWSLDDGTSVGGIRVRADSDLPRGEHTGRYAAATGIWNPVSRTIDRAVLIPQIDDFRRADRVSLEGYVQERLDDGGWVVAGYAVGAGTADTSDFTVDAFVRVDASVGESGQFTADRIEVFETDRIPAPPRMEREQIDRGRVHHESPDAREHDTPESPEHHSSESSESPEYHAHESPEYHTHEAPDYDTPESPDYDTPEAPDYDAPESPDFESPEVPDYEVPEVPDYEAPEAPDSPEVPEYEPPD